MLAACDRYCELTGRARATVSTLVMNDGKFFDRIASGKDFRMGTFERVMGWFAANTPKAHQHPEPATPAGEAAA